MPMTINQFIETYAARLTAEELRPLCSKRLQPVTRKMLRSVGRDADELLHIIQFLVRICAEFDEFQGVASISPVRREAAFALKYFLEDNDAIPDSEKEFGLKDDLIIAGAVLEKHRKSLQPFADACGYQWKRLIPGE